MDPRLSARLGASFVEDRFPDWTHEAACAGRTTADWFSDDVADPGLKREPIFPDSVYVALAVCAGCPVKRECIEMAYEVTVPVSWGWAITERGGHTIDCRDSWCQGCIPESQEVRFEEVTLEPMHAGIFGVPALIRERMDGPNRVERCLEWLGRVARERHFGTPTAQREEQVS